MDYRVGFLGIPSSVTQFEMSVPVPWTRETVGQLKKLGFNTIQLTVAWGRRPGDEPLNLEDVVQLSPEQDREYPQVVPLRCQPGPEAREKRRTELRHRIALCREAGLRTIFHFGAPFLSRLGSRLAAQWHHLGIFAVLFGAELNNVFQVERLVPRTPPPGHVELDGVEAQLL